MFFLIEPNKVYVLAHSVTNKGTICYQLRWLVVLNVGIGWRQSHFENNLPFIPTIISFNSCLQTFDKLDRTLAIDK